jgi:hypothetical protein
VLMLCWITGSIVVVQATRSDVRSGVPKMRRSMVSMSEPCAYAIVTLNCAVCRMRALDFPPVSATGACRMHIGLVGPFVALLEVQFVRECVFSRLVMYPVPSRRWERQAGNVQNSVGLSAAQRSSSTSVASPSARIFGH